MPENNAGITDLVQGFAKNIKALKSPEMKEAQIRLHYLDPFWQLLGWDVQNQEKRAPQDVDVIVEPSIDSAEDEGFRSRAPDYLFRLNVYFRISGFPGTPYRFLDFSRPALHTNPSTTRRAPMPLAT
jgi:hypothetical protein